MPMPVQRHRLPMYIQMPDVRERCIGCVARTIRTLPVSTSPPTRRPSRFSRNRYVLRYHRNPEQTFAARARSPSTGRVPPGSRQSQSDRTHSTPRALRPHLEAVQACISQWERLLLSRDLDSRPCALGQPQPCTSAARGAWPHRLPLCRRDGIRRPIPGTAAWNVEDR